MFLHSIIHPVADQGIAHRFLTLEEVSRMLRIAKGTVYRMARRNEIPAAKVGRQWRFEQSKINEWLSENQFSSSAISR